jgi:hypothetical protein
MRLTTAGGGRTSPSDAEDGLQPSCLVEQPIVFGPPLAQPPGAVEGVSGFSRVPRRLQAARFVHAGLDQPAAWRHSVRGCFFPDRLQTEPLDIL